MNFLPSLAKGKPKVITYGSESVDFKAIVHQLKFTVAGLGKTTISVLHSILLNPGKTEVLPDLPPMAPLRVIIFSQLAMKIHK